MCPLINYHLHLVKYEEPPPALPPESEQVTDITEGTALLPEYEDVTEEITSQGPELSVES